jgi:two-component system response regulator NreC
MSIDITGDASVQYQEYPNIRQWHRRDSPSCPWRRKAVSDTAASISIVLIDDHAVVRSALRILLEREEGFEVVAEGGDAESAARYAGGHRPDVLVLDLNPPDETGLAAIPQIRERCPETKIVVLTMSDNTKLVRKALRAGVHGYILKETAEEELIKAVSLAAQSKRYVQPSLGASLASEEIDSGPPGGLSQREAEVLHFIALGHTNAEIAGMLFLSVRTIESHRASIQSKLELSGRAELVHWAIEHGLANL